MILLKKISLVCLTFTGSIVLAKDINIPWSASQQNYSNQVKTAINNANPGDKIRFQGGKVYPFKSEVQVTKGGLTFNSFGSGKATLRMTAASNHFFSLQNGIPNNSRTSFINIKIDGNDNIKKQFVSSIIYSKGKKITLNKAEIRDGRNGVRAEIGKALHGLIVDQSDFYEIDDICILIQNRKSGTNYSTRKEIRALTERFVIKRSHFHPGFQRAIISDCGNDFYNVPANQIKGSWEKNFNGKKITPQKRYTFTTNLKNSLIQDNDFEGWKKWCIGFVQSRNATIENNRMINQSNSAQAYNAIVHLEQFVSDVTIRNNTMTNNKAGAAAFIDTTGSEAQRRLQNVPEIVTMGLGDGTDGLCGIGAATSNTQTHRYCALKKHSYGLRRVYIYGNKFNAGQNATKLKHVMTFTEVEDLFIGVKKDGSVARNTWNIANAPKDGMISIKKGDIGVCGVVINEKSSVTKKYKILGKGGYATKNAISINNAGSCIKIVSGGNKSLLETNDTTNKFSVYPVPASETLSIDSSSINDTTYDIEVYSLTGDLVAQDNGITSNTTYNLNISQFAPGVYILRCIDNNEISTISFIVE